MLASLWILICATSDKEHFIIARPTQIALIENVVLGLDVLSYLPLLADMNHGTLSGGDRYIDGIM
jgi:hypothetical protein